MFSLAKHGWDVGDAKMHLNLDFKLLSCLTESKVKISERKISSFAIVRIAYSEEQSLISFWKSSDYDITALGILALNVLTLFNVVH